MDSATATIALHSLTLRAGEKLLTDRLHHTVFTGHLCVVTGPSGSGKTTLLRAVLGLARPVSGDISLFGTVLDELNVWSSRQRVSYVPQEPDMGEGTVREVLRRPFGYKAARTIHWDEARVRDMMGSLHLGKSLLDDDIRQLSGGERQRVAIAAALLLERDLLVMDEPTSALDSRSRDAVARILGERGRITVIAASHDVRLMDTADSIIRMGEGA